MPAYDFNWQLFYYPKKNVSLPKGTRIDLVAHYDNSTANKRNPDPAELVRGRSARTIAALTAMLGILKGLPLGYQRDLQEDKPPLFGAVAAYEGSLGVLAGLISTLSVDRDAMATAAAEGYTTATTLADALVRRGVPFRSAHHVVGRCTKHRIVAANSVTPFGRREINRTRGSLPSA